MLAHRAQELVAGELGQHGVGGVTHQVDRAFPDRFPTQHVQLGERFQVQGLAGLRTQSDVLAGAESRQAGQPDIFDVDAVAPATELVLHAGVDVAHGVEHRAVGIDVGDHEQVDGGLAGAEVGVG